MVSMKNNISPEDRKEMDAVFPGWQENTPDELHARVLNWLDDTLDLMNDLKELGKNEDR